MHDCLHVTAIQIPFAAQNLSLIGDHLFVNQQLSKYQNFFSLQALLRSDLPFYMVPFQTKDLLFGKPEVGITGELFPFCSFDRKTRSTLETSTYKDVDGPCGVGFWFCDLNQSNNLKSENFLLVEIGEYAGTLRFKFILQDNGEKFASLLGAISAYAEGFSADPIIRRAFYLWKKLEFH